MSKFGELNNLIFSGIFIIVGLIVLIQKPFGSAFEDFVTVVLSVLISLIYLTRADLRRIERVYLSKRSIK